MRLLARSGLYGRGDGGGVMLAAIFGLLALEFFIEHAPRTDAEKTAAQARWQKVLERQAEQATHKKGREAAKT